MAVRPASVAEMLDEVVVCGVAAPKLCVSLAAGIPLRNLRSGLPDAMGCGRCRVRCAGLAAG